MNLLMRILLTLGSLAALALDPVYAQDVELPVSRETAERLVRTEYAGYVPAIMVEAEEDFSSFDRNSEFEGERYFEVSSCGPMGAYSDIAPMDSNPEEEAIVGSPEDVVLMRGARYIVSMRLSLQRGGYPAGAFEAIIAGLERETIENAIRAWTGEPRPDVRRDEFGNALEPDPPLLEDEMESIRVQVAPHLPPFRGLWACGGIESPAIIRSRPAGARVWIITQFRFLHCRAQNLDAWSTSQCRHWVQVRPDRRYNVAGRFVYLAEWPNGTVGNGRGMITPTGDFTDVSYTIEPGRIR